MANIIVTMKDGEIRKFMHKGRSGGSYTKEIRYEGEFAIITDEWDKQIAIPAKDIKEISVEPHRARF